MIKFFIGTQKNDTMNPELRINMLITSLEGRNLSIHPFLKFDRLSPGPKERTECLCTAEEKSRCFSIQRAKATKWLQSFLAHQFLPKQAHTSAYRRKQ